MAENKFLYDVFISYSGRDGEWVRGWLLKRLEEARFTFYAYELKPIVGASILPKLGQLIEQSRYTLPVLSPAYLGSGWCAPEWDMAQYLSLEERRTRLIPLMLESCKPPLHMRYLGYLDFTDSSRREERFLLLAAALRGEKPQLELRADDLAERNYVEKVYNECRYVQTELEEDKIPLTDVYVMLQAQHTPKRRADVPPGEERPAEAGIPPKHIPAPEEPPEELKDVLKKHTHLLILGEPGAGKTTLLQYIALCFANDLLPEESQELKPNLSDLGLEREPRLPIRIDLRRYGSLGFKSQESWLGKFIVNYLSGEYNVPEAQAEGWLNDERLTILLDGLDEVSTEGREQVIKAINRFAIDSQGRGQRIIVSSRIAAYREKPALDEEKFKPYTLRPLDNEKAAKLYIAGWLRALDPAKEKEAEKLWDALHGQKGLARAMTNPLLLRMAVSVYAQTGEIVKNRAGLYRLYVEKSLLPRAHARDERERTLPEDEAILKALEAVAWTMQVEGKDDEDALAGAIRREVAGVSGKLLKDLRHKVGLLIVYGQEESGLLRNLYAFRHATFREYFVARRLKKSWQANAEKAWAFLQPRLYEDAWRETILLFTCLTEQKEIDDFLGRVLLKPREAKWPWEFPAHLRLVVEALVQGANATNTFQDRVAGKLETLARDEKVEDWVRREAAE
ncbi:MAG: TIR domain-containing protein, partial [Anaerolineae bacterium]